MGEMLLVVEVEAEVCVICLTVGVAGPGCVGITGPRCIGVGVLEVLASLVLDALALLVLDSLAVLVLNSLALLVLNLMVSLVLDVLVLDTLAASVWKIDVTMVIISFPRIICLAALSILPYLVGHFDSDSVQMTMTLL